VVGQQPARILLLSAPTGFEQFVLELCAPADAVPAPPDMAAVMAAAANYKIDILGPLPKEPCVTRSQEDIITTIVDTSTSLKQAVEQIRNPHVAAVSAGNADAATSLSVPDGIFLPLEIVTLDERLMAAARREGLVLTEVPLPESGA